MASQAQDARQRPHAGARTLRQAAAGVFAVTTIVPLLIFVWTLYRLDALYQSYAQIGLALALALALLGFQVFRVLMGRMSNLIQALGRVVEQSARWGPPAELSAPAARPPLRPRSGPVGWPTPTQGDAKVGLTPTRSPDMPVPGIGRVREVSDLSRAMALLWMAEATFLKNQRVSVALLNAASPVRGTLLELRDDGLVVEPDGAGAPLVVGYGSIAAIEPDQLPLGR